MIGHVAEIVAVAEFSLFSKSLLSFPSMPRATVALRKELDRDLAQAQAVWRAGRVDAAGRDEGLWQNTKVAEAQKVCRRWNYFSCRAPDHC